MNKHIRCPTQNLLFGAPVADLELNISEDVQLDVTVVQETFDLSVQCRLRVGAATTLQQDDVPRYAAAEWVVDGMHNGLHGIGEVRGELEALHALDELCGVVQELSLHGVAVWAGLSVAHQAISVVWHTWNRGTYVSVFIASLIISITDEELFSETAVV